MNLIKNYFSYFFLLISILLCAYIFYKSEIYWNGDIRYYYFKYYIVCSLLLLFSLLSFYLSLNIKIYITIIMISAAFGLYSFEIYLNYFKKGLGYDNQTKEQAYTKIKDEIPNLVLEVTPSNYFDNDVDVLPLSGISKSKTLGCNDSGYFSIIKTDRYGFNNPDEVWNKNEVDYVLIGDSFTLGSCVNRPHDIGSVLRKISKKSVLNLGIGGNGPLSSYASLKEYLPKKTKNIVWFYFEGNDNENLISELKNKFLKKYYNEKNFIQNLKNKQNIIDSMGKNEIQKLISKKNIKKTQTVFDRIKIIKLNEVRLIIRVNYKKLLNYFENNNSEINKDLPSNEFIEIITLTKNIAKEINSDLYFVYLPEYSRFNNKYNNDNYKKIKEIINEYDINFIDIIEEVFKKEKEPLKLFPVNLGKKVDVHYNEEGYFKVGKKVYEIINKEN